MNNFTAILVLTVLMVLTCTKSVWFNAIASSTQANPDSTVLYKTLK